MNNRVKGMWAACLAAGLLGACTPLGLNTAKDRVEPENAATPPLLAPFGDQPAVRSVADWMVRREHLKAAFERHVYGPVPVQALAREQGRRVVDPQYAGGLGVLEEIDVEVGAPDHPLRFRIAIALPKAAGAEGPAPVIISENFCGNQGQMGSEALSAPASGGGCSNSGFMARVIRLIFGVHIIEAPVAEILSRGYGYATIYPSDLVADDPERAREDLMAAALALEGQPAPTSALAVWAAAFGWAIDVLDVDRRIDPSRTAVYGHSRHGKAALLAAGFDDRIEASIVHQSGKGGATLTRAYAGESVKQITSSYPHWFDPAYAAYSEAEADSPVDQHQLIALAAPRAMLLGNGWKDVWSDPTGSFAAAEGAAAAWELFSNPGLSQETMRDPPGAGALEFFIRAGGHGVRRVDWAAFLDFLDRRLARSATAP